MTDHLDAHFRKGPEFYFDVCLDKVVVDWDIKMFVEKYLPCNSWLDLTQSDMAACYLKYHGRQLKTWEEIVLETYWT